MKWLYWMIVGVLKFFFKLFYRFKVVGRSHLRPGGGLIVANHVSFLDPPAIACSVKEQIHFLARKSLFKGFFAWMFPRFNVHPVDPELSNLQVLKEICQLIKEGKKVLIFPEGTRSSDGTLQQLQQGVALILSRTKTAFFPAYVHGMHSIWQRDKKLPKLLGKLTVSFGPAIEWDSLPGKTPKEKQQEAMSRLKGCLQHLEKQGRPNRKQQRFLKE